ncbi:kinase-like domain-containing protein [Lasiosphaeria ovina]|uniref:Kinase-like domain-containing protein n=1 Tax=Lasiosphaeria ovina TaxID=92902 RepID=A0AAE0KDJ3_9PEZI|nr:kinase-like domain-containing protein [Lasiosphaeria ovina]
MDSGNEVEDDVSPSSTPYLLYHISVDSSLGHQEAIDLISFLAIACDLGVPLLPMTWQAARERLGLGGSGDVRQALVDVQTSLAFKLVKDEDKAQREVELVLRIFANELIALSRPNLRAHPHIVDLLGICWDNPSTGGVWPALLFEKSQYSDLYNFSTLLVWRELAAMERLDLCLQIGSAIAEMHDQDIIHGDIKPQNVLVFKLDGRYVTKVTDFGYSSWFRDDTDRIRLPRSRPWHAPEGDRLSRNFSFAEAKRADIFSYALLCFWILFEKDLSSKAGAYLAEENLRPTSKGGGQQVPHSIRALGRLKQTDLLIDAVPQLLTEELGASGHAETLLEFFRSALIFDPDQRMESLCTFEILQSYRKDLGQVAIKSDYVNAITQLHGTNRFEVRQAEPSSSFQPLVF